MMTTNYELLDSQLRALIDNEPDALAAASNATHDSKRTGYGRTGDLPEGGGRVRYLDYLLFSPPGQPDR